MIVHADTTHLPSDPTSANSPAISPDVGDLLTDEQRAFAVVIGRELAARWPAESRMPPERGLPTCDVHPTK